MKLIASLFLLICLCASTAAPARALGPDRSDDGSVASLAKHWAGTNPDRLSVLSTEYGGQVKDGPMVLYQPKIKNPDGTLPPPFMVTPLLKSILDKVFATMGLDGGYPTINQLIQAAVQSAVSASMNAMDPAKQPPAAQAAQAAAGQQAGDSAGGAAKDNAAGAIDFCSRFMQNFANDGGSRWNRIRDSIFIPIAVLLLLPGAVLAQVKAIASAGNPVLGNVNPFDGILRAIVAVFLIPATYLVISYGIDFSNCITFTISDQYTRMFGSNMYKDALCGELRAMPTNGASASAGNGSVPPWPQGADLESQNFGNGSPDPCGGAPAAPGHVNEAMPANVVYSRLAVYGANAASTTGWNILCAFQMAYLCYLYLVGPIVAALWVWPVKQLREALPNWIEGVITLCFWSMFWNTTILLMACFKDYGTTGTYIFTALNFLSTSCVKYAFDFAGLVAAAGQDAAQKATQPQGSGSAGGGSAAGKGSGASASAGKLPPGAHLLPGMAGGKMHAVDANGHMLTFDSKSGTWVPDTTGSGSGNSSGAGGEGGGGSGGEGGALNLSSSYAGSVVPVGVNHVPPPLSGASGTFSTPIPNSDYHLQIGSDGKGGFTGQLVDEHGQLIGTPMSMVSDGSGGFKLDLPNGETLTVSPNSMGGATVEFTQTSSGAMIAQDTFGAAGQATLQFAGQNGDLVYVSNLGNGLEAITVIGATGSVDTFVGSVGEPLSGFASDGTRVDVLTDANGNPVSISLDHTPGIAGGLESFAVTTNADGSSSIRYTGVDGQTGAFETVSAPLSSGNGTSSITTAFYDSNHNALGSQVDTIASSAGGVSTDTIGQFDSTGKQVGQLIDDAGNNQIVSGMMLNADGTVTLNSQVPDPSGKGSDWLQTTYASVDQNFVPLNAIASAQVRADGTVENKTYADGKLFEDKIVAADGTTILSDAQYSYAANGNVEYSQTTYGADGSYVAISSVVDANNTLMQSSSTSFDASGASIGYATVEQNQQGGYDVKQYDARVDAANPVGHLIASESTSVGADGTVYDTSICYSNGSGGSVSDENTSVAISYAAGTSSPRFEIHSGGQVETISQSANGQYSAYHLDSAGQRVYDSANYDWANNSVSVNNGSEVVVIRGDAADGYVATVSGSTLSGHSPAVEQFTFPGGNTNQINAAAGDQRWSASQAPQGVLPGLAAKFVPAGFLSKPVPGQSSKSGSNAGDISGKGGRNAGDSSGKFGTSNLNGGTVNDGNNSDIRDKESDLFKDASDEPDQAFAIDEFTDSSLQDQIIAAASHVRNTSTINSVLRKSYAGNSRPEAVVAATVDQNIATIYCGQGKYGQAEELYKNALHMMDSYQDAPEYFVLIETYANFLDRQGRTAEADAYRAMIGGASVQSLVSW
ncbi:MAG: tetratricopeptide repeat protein [Candidatus Obscuribacterales bacterium]